MLFFVNYVVKNIPLDLHSFLELNGKHTDKNASKNLSITLSLLIMIILINGIVVIFNT